MNCRYCGAGLPTKGGVCPNCGKLIPMDQQRDMRQMLDPKWNDYRNQNTAMYKKESAYDSDAKIGKIVVFIVLIIVIIILIAIFK